MRAARRGPTPSARASRLVLRHDRQRQRSGDSADRIARRAGADALHRRQQAEPVALGGIDKAVEMDVVLADMRLDQQPRRAPGGGSRPRVRVEQKAR
jgi:hypothetical protein